MCVEWFYGYAFEAGDYACVNQVMYQCNPDPYTALCAVNAPDSDEGASAWSSTALPYSPAPLTKSAIDCETYRKGFNYRESDLVCEAGAVWECLPFPESMNCSAVKPSSKDGSLGWKQTTMVAPASVENICDDWVYGDPV